MDLNGLHTAVAVAARMAQLPVSLLYFAMMIPLLKK